METRSLPVPDGLVGERADSALSKLLGFSRSFAAEVIDAGGVTANGHTLGKSDRLARDAWLEVQWQPREAPAVVPLAVPELTIVHDDDDIVVVDKPIGVAAHPSIGWDGPTVLGALAAAGFRVSTSGAAERAGIVHRLDAGTSGLMVVAKSERAYSDLKRQFHDREVDKIYHAVVQGHPDPLTGTIDAPIGRHPGSKWKFAVVSDGKPSITHYETLEAFPSASLHRGAPGDRANPPDPRAHGRPAAPLCGRRDVRRRPDDQRAAGSESPVAARGATGLHPPGSARVRRVPHRVPGRPPARARRTPPRLLRGFPNWRAS